MDKPIDEEIQQEIARCLASPDWVDQEFGRRLKAAMEACPGAGLTTRLSSHCRACGDELPSGAVYCINCRTKV